jgi:hypothetical protein
MGERRKMGGILRGDGTGDKSSKENGVLADVNLE